MPHSPVCLQIFDEILVNAADNKARDDTMDTLKVDIDVVSEGGVGRAANSFFSKKVVCVDRGASLCSPVGGIGVMIVHVFVYLSSCSLLMQGLILV